MIVKILILLIAIEHLYILWIEMFAWETTGKKIFNKVIPSELYKPTKSLAANQGLYNGFLAAGLIWSIFIENFIWEKNVAIFFLTCIVAAGIFGGITASKKIFFVQGLPAIITLILIYLSE